MPGDMRSLVVRASDLYRVLPNVTRGVRCTDHRSPAVGDKVTWMIEFLSTQEEDCPLRDRANTERRWSVEVSIDDRGATT